MNENIELSFLKNVKLDVVTALSPPKKEPVLKTPPDAVDMRVFADGKIFPSANFAKNNKLEYQARTPLDDTGKNFAVKGNGVDLFSSADWSQIQGKLPEGVEILFGCISAKALAKVDLWSSTKYTEDNEPKATVFTQGAQTFGKNTLLPTLTELYGVNWDETAYVDLKFGEALPAVDDSVYHLPKMVSSGPKKGQATFVRREGVTICPVTIVGTKEKDVKQTNITDAIAEAEKEEAPAIDFEGDLGGMDVEAEEVKATK